MPFVMVTELFCVQCKNRMEMTDSIIISRNNAPFSSKATFTCYTCMIMIEVIDGVQGTWKFMRCTRCKDDTIEHMAGLWSDLKDWGDIDIPQDGLLHKEFDIPIILDKKWARKK